MNLAWGIKDLSGLKFLVVICVYLCLSAVSSLAQGLPLATPASVGMNAAKLDQLEAIINADIADKKLPGAVVIVGRKGKIVYRKAFGNRSLVPTVEKMTVDTIFDVASLTKPVATATSIMILIEQGKLRLNDTIGKFIPDIDDELAAAPYATQCPARSKPQERAAPAQQPGWGGRPPGAPPPWRGSRRRPPPRHARARSASPLRRRLSGPGTRRSATTCSSTRAT